MNMSNEKNLCKVCEKEISLSERFCPRCKFEQHIYPSVVPIEYEEYEKERIRIATIQWREIQQMKDEIETLKEQCQSSLMTNAAGRPAGFLVVRQSLREEVFELYEGDNSFGRKRGGIDAPNHQKLNFLDDALQANHFSIVINLKENKYTLVDRYYDNASWCIKDAKSKRQKSSLISGDKLLLGGLELRFHIA